MPTAITPTEITPGTSGSYQTVDITSLVGSDAGNVEAVHLRIYAASAQSFGVRATGSINDTYAVIASTDWLDMSIKVDSSDTFEAHISSTTDVDIYMWGYSTTDEAEFLVDGDDFESDLTEATFSNVDVSALFTGTAQAAFGTLQSTGFNYGTWAVRPDTSTFSQLHIGPRTGDGNVKPFAMYCVSEVFEMYVANLSERTVLLNGVLIDGVTGSATADTYDPHGTGESGTWQTEDLTAGSNTNAGDTFVIAHVYPTNSQTHTSGLRPDSGGPSHLSAVFTSRAHFSFIPMAAGDLLDLYAADSGQTDPRVGLTIFGTADATPAGGGGGVTVSGVVMTASGGLNVPTVSAIQNVSISGVTMTATGQLEIPAVTIAVDVAGEVMVGTADLNAPTIITGVSVPAETFTATAGLNLPAILVGGSNSVNAVPLTATGELLTPTVVTGGLIAGEEAVATASLNVPTILTGTLITADVMVAAGDSPVPDLTQGQDISAVVFESTASFLIPTVNPGATIVAVPFTATARLFPPGINGGASEGNVWLVLTKDMLRKLRRTSHTGIIQSKEPLENDRA